MTRVVEPGWLQIAADVGQVATVCGAVAAAALAWIKKNVDNLWIKSVLSCG
jgi:hypothetical protein